MPDSSREEIAKLEALYANNPAGRVFTHLAEAYRKAGELDRARGILNDGLQKHPGYASAYVVLGRVLMDLQENDDATSAFRQVLELDPHNLVALRSLGELARGAGRTEEAVQYFEQLRQHDPGNDEIEQIITQLRSPEEPVPAEETQSPLAEEMPPAPAEFGGRSVTTEFKAEPSEPDWQLEPTFAPEQFEASEPATEAGAEALPTPAPEPWETTIWEPEQEGTPEAASPFDAGTGMEDLQLGWLAAEPEPEPVFEAPADELGDLSSLSAAADVVEELKGDTFAPEEIDLGGGLGIEPVSEVADPEVQTETIAELYRRQGLYDRAAEVYRALLQQRAGDVHLQAKLAEVEALARPGADLEPVSETQPVEAVPEPWAEPEPAESEPDAEDAAPWLAGGNAHAENTPTPYAWTDTAVDVAPEAGRPIADYFRTLLAWQPRAAAAPVVEEAAVVADEPVTAPDEPATAPEPAAQTEAATAEEAFDEWFGAAPAAELEAAPVQEDVAIAPSQAEAASADEGDDDDDLEMFRSWLQSLKK